VRSHGGELPVLIDGKHMFAAQDVEKYAQHSDGKLAAMAFEQFNQGKSPVELVIEMKIPPQRIEKIHDAWGRMSSAVVVVAPSPFTITRWKRMLRVDRFSWTMIAKALEIIMRDPKLVDSWMEDIHRGKARK
jgi:hypothetical protein